MTLFAIVCMWAILFLTPLPVVPEPTAFEKTTSFIVKTMDRPQSLARLLRSVHAQWPCAPLLVGDDGEAPVGEALAEELGATKYLRLPPDAGLSAVRNALVDGVETPYFVLCDDDYEFAGRADPAKLVAPVASGQADIVCGGLYLPKTKGGKKAQKDYYYAGLMSTAEEDGRRVLRLVEGNRGGVPGHSECSFVDIGINFFAARTEAVREVRWDDALKLAEHEDFFLRSKDAGLRVALCQDVLILHHKDKGNTRYAELRKRGRDMWKLALAKHHLDMLVLFNGYWATVTEYERLLEETYTTVAPLLPPAAEDDLGSVGWKHLHTDAATGVSVWTRPSPVSRVAMFAARAHVKTLSAKDFVVRALVGNELRDLWNPMFKNCDIVDSWEGTGEHTKSVLLVHERMHSAVGGVVGQRDYVKAVTHFEAPGGAWCLLYHSVDDDRVPQEKGFVRGFSNASGTRASPIEGAPGECIVVTIVHTDPCGWIPAWAITKGVSGELVSLFKGFNTAFAPK
eukprot:m51a1_g11844 hypothetical protein (511) ;mRNA; r:467265-469593